MYGLCPHEFVICVRTVPIQTSRLALERTTSLYTSGSTLSNSPHRITFLEKPIKNREGGCEGVRP
jgi:hypothetical protein